MVEVDCFIVGCDILVVGVYRFGVCDFGVEL